MSKDRGRRREVLTSVGLWIRSPFLRRQWPSIRNCIIALLVADGSFSSLIEFVMCVSCVLCFFSYWHIGLLIPPLFVSRLRTDLVWVFFFSLLLSSNPTRKVLHLFPYVLAFFRVAGVLCISCSRFVASKEGEENFRKTGSSRFLPKLLIFLQFLHEFSRRVRSKHPI